MNASTATENSKEDSNTVQVFYDGLCPVCRREIDLLRRLDKQGNLRPIDFAAPDFDAAAYGLELADLVSRMYVRDANGVWHEGLDSFPVMWAAVGWGWLWWWTRMPGLRQLGMAGYSLFRRVRPRFSGFKPCEDGCSCGRPRRVE